MWRQRQQQQKNSAAASEHKWQMSTINDINQTLKKCQKAP
jgi:hypothetical protein